VLYEAREKALARIESAAEKCGADEVVGVKTSVYDLGGGLVEFMAIGTAVKKFAGVKTKNDVLPPQAIIQDRDTFIDSTKGSAINIEAGGKASAVATQAGPMRFIIFVFIALFYIFSIFMRTHQ
jgi:hypothetical protein